MYPAHPRPRRTGTPPRGFALLFTLVAIVIVSALVVATMFRVTENNYLAQLTTLRLHVMAESERRLWTAMDDPELFELPFAPIGTTKRSTSTEDGVTTIITVTKVDSTLLWLVATTTAQRGRLSAAHRTAVSAQLAASLLHPATPLQGVAWVDLY